MLTYTKLSPLYNYTIHVRKDTRASPVLGGHVDKAIFNTHCSLWLLIRVQAHPVNWEGLWIIFHFFSHVPGIDPLKKKAY